jgi:hypothetical protein
VIEPRLVYYVVTRPAPGRAGRVREYYSIDAFLIALTATLYVRAGLRRVALKNVMDSLTRAPWPLPGPRSRRNSIPASESVLPRAIIWLYYYAEMDARFDIGDMDSLRIKARGFDSHWVRLDNWRRLDPADRPQTVIRQDLGRLRRAFDIDK